MQLSKLAANILCRYSLKKYLVDISSKDCDNLGANVPLELQHNYKNWFPDFASTTIVQEILKPHFDFIFICITVLILCIHQGLHELWPLDPRQRRFCPLRPLCTEAANYRSDLKMLLTIIAHGQNVHLILLPFSIFSSSYFWEKSFCGATKLQVKHTDFSYRHAHRHSHGQ